MTERSMTFWGWEEVARDEMVGTTKDNEETFGVDGHVHYLNCGDSFIGAHIC